MEWLHVQWNDGNTQKCKIILKPVFSTGILEILQGELIWFFDKMEYPNELLH